MRADGRVKAEAVVSGDRVGAYEQAYAELEQVLAQLEEGGLGLEASVRLYERGMVLAATCERLIEQAELRVTQLSPEGAGLLAHPEDDGEAAF